MRPPLNRNINVQDFTDFYWLKSELQHFCKSHELSTTGSKQELADRIVTYLTTGKKQSPVKRDKKQAFTEIFSLDAVVPAGFTCTREARNFFESHTDKHFKFSVQLQRYIKNNPEITFRDIITEYKRLEKLRKEGKLKTTISSQFEYNQFTRDFFADPKNKNKSKQDCIDAWNAVKKTRGPNTYKK